MIWIVGGTTEGRLISETLNQKNLEFCLSVATDLGEKTYQGLTPNFFKGRLDPKGFEEKFIENQVDWVIDASHPHAIEVSKSVIEACKALNITYTRFERMGMENTAKKEGVLYFDGFDEAFEYLKETEGTIFLTGSKEIQKAIAHVSVDRLAVRVAPSTEAIGLCEKAGIQAEKIIAMKGPFSLALNQMMLRHFQVSYFVFKESGSVGGYEEKVQGSLLEGVTPVVVRMPTMTYPETVNNLEVLVSQIDGYSNQVC